MAALVASAIHDDHGTGHIPATRSNIHAASSLAGYNRQTPEISLQAHEISVPCLSCWAVEAAAMASMLYSHIPQVIGIVGAGQMGSGIAQVCATKGLDVVISDHSAGW
jgi:phosphoglycerate dehydrogenase-like enzyme